MTGASDIKVVVSANWFTFTGQVIIIYSEIYSSMRNVNPPAYTHMVIPCVNTNKQSTCDPPRKARASTTNLGNLRHVRPP